jgi:hypothetical protein
VRTVILLCEHSADGRSGWSSTADRHAGCRGGAPDPPAAKGARGSGWGLVEPQRGWILMPAAPPDGEGLEVTNGVPVDLLDAALGHRD